MMTACEPCRWTFQVSLTLCRLYSEGVIETFDLYRPYRADRISISVSRVAVGGPYRPGPRRRCGDGLLDGCI